MAGGPDWPNCLRPPGMLTEDTAFVLKILRACLHYSVNCKWSQLAPDEEETPTCPETEVALGFVAVFSARERCP